MRRNVQNFVLMLLSVALASQTAFAEQSDWENVRQLTPGQEIKLRLFSGKSYRGSLQAVTDNGVILSSGQTVPKSDVRRLLSKNRSHRGKHALIGAGIGAAAGLSLGAAADSDCTKTSYFCTGNAGKAIGTPLFAIIGLAIGAALPSNSWHEVYRSK